MNRVNRERVLFHHHPTLGLAAFSWPAPGARAALERLGWRPSASFPTLTPPTGTDPTEAGIRAARELNALGHRVESMAPTDRRPRAIPDADIPDRIRALVAADPSAYLRPYETPQPGPEPNHHQGPRP